MRVRGAWAAMAGVANVAMLGVAIMTGCYHAEPLDIGRLLGDLRAADQLPPSSSETPPRAPAGVLTEERSVALALGWNQALRALRLSRGIPEGQIVTAETLANPVFRFDLTHLQDGADGLGWDARLSWAPPQPGVRGGRIGAAKATLTEYDWQIREQEWTLVCNVRAAYAGLLAIDEEIRIADESVVNRRKLVELIKRQVEQGGSTRFNFDLISLSLTNAERAQSARKLARSNAAIALTQLLGVGAPDGGTISVTGTLDDEARDAVLPCQAALEDRALAHRPALEAARAQYEVSEQSLRAETAARWPWLVLSAIPRIRQNEALVARTDVAVGVDVTLPIFDTNVGRVQSATAARAVARAQMTSTVAGVRNDIAQALAAIWSNRELLERVHVEIEPLLKEHDRLLALVMKAGELDLTSLIASEDLVLAARTELIQAKLQLRDAYVALERAVGPAEAWQPHK
jgi:cobalt-zinc-cadmium efflux system outer membrane protein